MVLLLCIVCHSDCFSCLLFDVRLSYLINIAYIHSLAVLEAITCFIPSVNWPCMSAFPRHVKSTYFLVILCRHGERTRSHSSRTPVPAVCTLPLDCMCSEYFCATRQPIRQSNHTLRLLFGVPHHTVRRLTHYGTFLGEISWPVHPLNNRWKHM